MISYRFEQRRLLHRDRLLHFVTSEPLTDKARTAVAAPLGMWVLMDRGQCHAVMSRVSALPEPEVDRALLEWVDRHLEILLS